MTVDHAIRVVQTAYPRLYFACHTRHQRRRSPTHRLSSRDSDILAHLDPDQPITPSMLATHLGRARSTVSEALKRLIALGYVERTVADPAASRHAVRLTPSGAEALGETSVLETDRLRMVLQTLPASDLRKIIAGFACVSQAVHTFTEQRSSGKRRR